MFFQHFTITNVYVLRVTYHKYTTISQRWNIKYIQPCYLFKNTEIINRQIVARFGGLNLGSTLVINVCHWWSNLSWMKQFIMDLPWMKKFSMDIFVKFYTEIQKQYEPNFLGSWLTRDKDDQSNILLIQFISQHLTHGHIILTDRIARPVDYATTRLLSSTPRHDTDTTFLTTKIRNLTN